MSGHVHGVLLSLQLDRVDMGYSDKTSVNVKKL